MPDTTPTTPDRPTTSPIRFRRTRIAVSDFFGVVTVLLMLAWVRSYWIFARFAMNVGNTQYAVTCKTNFGKCTMALVPRREIAASYIWGMNGGYRHPLDNLPFAYSFTPRATGYGFIQFPIWVLILPTMFVTFAFMALNGTRQFRQFSLRTMLIATTLVAAMLRYNQKLWMRS
jgi:hypothetical protein